MRILSATLAVLALTLPAYGQSSGRLGPSQLGAKYPKQSHVYATGAKASSDYGKGYTASEATGAPDVFPRFKDTKRVWTVKNKRSKSDWLELTFPATEAKGLIVFETWKPGAIVKITVGGRVVFEDAGKPKRYREAQGLWVEFAKPLKVGKVRVEVSPAKVGYYPEIDAVALIKVGGGAATPTHKKPNKADPPSGPEERNVILARQEVDAVATALKTLKPGDVPTANALMARLSKANRLLEACTQKRDPRWRKVVDRVPGLGAEVKSIGSRPAARPAARPKQPGRVTPDAFTQQAKDLLSEVARDLKVMPPGDRAVANQLIKKINTAVDLLTSSKTPSTLRQECAKLAQKLDPEVRAKAKEAPGRPAPGKGERRLFAPSAKPSIRFGDGYSYLDSVRWDLAKAFVPQIEKLAEEGKIPRAKQLLWALWAEVKFSRDKTALPLYLRARDAIYGSEPVMRTDDGVVEANTQIQFARSALKAGNLTTATRVKVHLQALVQEGLKLPAATEEALQAMTAEQATAWKAANAAMMGPNTQAMYKAGRSRGKLDLGSRLHKLSGDLRWIRKIGGRYLTGSIQNTELLQRFEPLLLGVLVDFDASRKALPAFATAPFDPEFVDRYVVEVTKTNPEFRAYAHYLVGAIRGAAFGTEALKSINLPRETWRIYHEVVEGAFTEAEQAFQRIRTGEAHARLKFAASWIAHAKVNRLPEAELAQLRARLKEIKGSAGVGKLRRADLVLTKAEKALKGATAKGSFDYAKEQLKTAEAWLKESKKGGVDAKELARVEKRFASLQGPVWTASLLREAERPLARAERYLTEARKHVGKAEHAFDALNPLWHAEKQPKNTEPFLSRLTDASARQAVEGRIAKIKAAVIAIRKQVAENQRVPKDTFAGKGSWRGRFKRLVQKEHDWKVLALNICDADWKETTAKYEYAGSGNTRVHETRWYKHLHAWVAIQNADDPKRVDLRYLGFRLHKMTDGSYRMLKLYRVGDANPMLKKNLP